MFISLLAVCTTFRLPVFQFQQSSSLGCLSALQGPDSNNVPIEVSLLLSSPFLFKGPLVFSPIIPLKCFSPSLKPHKHSQGCLTNSQPELTLLKDLGKLWSQGRGTAIHSGPPWLALDPYCLCTGTNVTPALLCSLSQVAPPTACPSLASRYLTGLS